MIDCAYVEPNEPQMIDIHVHQKQALTRIQKKKKVIDFTEGTCAGLYN